MLVASLKLRGAHPSSLLLVDLLQNAAVVAPSVKKGLLAGLRAVVLGEGSERGWAATSGPALPLSAAEARCLAEAVGWPLDGEAADRAGVEKLRRVRVVACGSAEEQAGALMEACADANVLVRQYAGLAPWV